MPRRPIFLAVLGLVTLGSLGLTVRPNEQESLRARVDTLESQIEEMQAELDRFQQLEEALQKSCTALQKSVATARKNGFEWAGANPQSRTDLLEGLQAFASQITATSRGSNGEDVDSEG